MSYRLRLGEPIPDALRAVVDERLERALRRLDEEHDEDPVKAVHGARKDLKKTRAALRLARPCMPRSAYRRENARLRDIGRRMSAGRDADVMVETVEALAERWAGQLPKRQFTALERRFAERAQETRDDTPVDELREVRERARGWPIDDCDERTLRAGATRAYRRGRKAFAAAHDDPTTERLHEWRKRAKDLWYHHRLLAEAWPGPVKAFADEADRLGKLLGDDHDLATLRERLGDGDELVEQLIAARRAELQEEAFELGRRLYAEKPRAFGRRLGRYLRAHAPSPAG